MKRYQTQRVMLYYQIKELLKDNFNKSQISRKLSISRTTLYFYASMSEEEFCKWVKEVKKKAGKLSAYEQVIKDRLKAHQDTSGYQMHDWLLEHYPELKVSRKAVSTFVTQLRQLYNLPKPSKSKQGREYEAIPELPYGQQAQVDFGFYTMKDANKEEVKICFMATVLSRSRYKHVYFQSRPFTTRDVIEAHEAAFSYFGGIPAQMVYDQDKLMVVSENAGDILFTEKFKAYIELHKYDLFVCRKRDPESKGKVENVVKYVKSNFLPGREYVNDEVLNAAAMAWLERTGNGQVHGTTKRIPAEELIIEKQYLRSFQPLSLSGFEYKAYHVRKDNLITYRSNRYSVPVGTYKGQGTQVWVKEKEGYLLICNAQKEELSRHKISIDKGVTISNTDHKRKKEDKTKDFLIQVAALFKDQQQAKEYLLQIKRSKPRYIRDQLRLIREVVKKDKGKCKDQALQFCHANRIYNAGDFNTVLQNLQQEQPTEQIPLESLLMKQIPTAYMIAQPEKSQISDYESIVNQPLN